MVRKTTIHDIARETALSPSAVSQILSGKRKGRPGNVQKIQRAIKRLGYHQNTHAQVLATGRTHTLGVAFLFDSFDLFNNQLLSWVEAHGRQAGYDLTPRNLLQSQCPVLLDRIRVVEDARKVFFEPLIRHRVEGVITQGYVVNARILESLLNEGIHVSLWEPEEEPPAGVAITRVDWLQVIRLAVNHLVQLGHTRIHFLAGVPDFVSTRESLEAFQKVMMEQDLDLSSSLHPADSLQSEDWGYRWMTQWIHAGCHPPMSALLCADDRLAMGVLSACYEYRFPVPERLSVVGIDDIHYSRFTCPPLTTVRIDVEDSARCLVEGVLDAIAGNPCRERTCHQELVIRQSTAVPAC